MHRRCLRAYRCFVFNNPPYPLFLCVTYCQSPKLRVVSLSFPIYEDYKKADCYYVYSVFSVVQYNQIVFL